MQQLHQQQPQQQQGSSRNSITIVTIVKKAHRPCYFGIYYLTLSYKPKDTQSPECPYGFQWDGVRNGEIHGQFKKVSKIVGDSLALRMVSQYLKATLLSVEKLCCTIVRLIVIWNGLGENV